MENIQLKSILYAFSSKDPSHPKLQSIYFDERGYAVTTDGRRLVACKQYFEEKHAGQSYPAQDWTEGKVQSPMEIPFPDWNNALPTSEYGHSFRLAIPGWFKYLENSPDKAIMTLDFRDLKLPKLVIGSFLTTGTLGLNGALLAPFAGQTLTVFVKDELSAIIFTSNEQTASMLRDPKTELLKMDWFGLLMPHTIDPVKDRSERRSVPTEIFV